MPQKRGRFIVFEGIDGSGKSTQAFLLSKYLGEQKMKVVATREPGGTVTGEEIRRVLLDPQTEDLMPKCELLLYMASRAQHVGRIIKPAVERGHVVICERYHLSSLAYQGYAGGLALEEVEAVGAFATGGFRPDLTIILDVDPEIAMERDKGPGTVDAGYDRIERKGIAFQRKVREGFLEITREHPEKIKIVDGSRGAKEVHEEVKRLVADVL